MSSEISEDQLIHYFAGECSEEEAAEIEAWIDADPNRQRRVARLRQMWEAAHGPRQTHPDVDAMWENLSRRLGADESEPDRSHADVPEGESPETERETSRRPRCRRRERRRRRSAFWDSSFRVSIAAICFVVLSIAAGVLYDGGLIDRGDASMRTIATEERQQARVQLGEGTKVVLNAKSTLTLPPEFGDEQREVHLQGQAYFEVEPEEGRPFLVHAGGSVTRVLGTKFGIGAYPEDEKVRVVVAEGKVAVRAEPEPAERNVTLTEREMASLSKSDRSMVRREVDPTPYLAWTKGQLVFRDASFEEVTRRLQTQYGLRVRLVGSPEEVDQLNATFTDEPVGEVLGIIAETLDLRYERKGKAVTFFVRDELHNE